MNKVKKILCLWIILFTQTVWADSFEPNNSKEQARLIELNKFYQTEFSGKDDQDWFSFEIKQSGYIVFSLQEEEVYKTYTRIKMVSVTNEEIISSGQELPITQFLKPQKYYFKIFHAHLEKPFYDKPFSFQLKFYENQDSWEPNNTPNEAKEIPFNTKISFHLFEAGDKDHFKFKITKRGLFRILASDQQSRYRFFVTELSSGGRQTTLEEKVWSRPQLGEYIIQFFRDPSSTEVWRQDLNHFFLQYMELEDPDLKEPNDEPSRAIKLKLNEPQEFYLFDFLDQDWFQFEVTEDQKNLAIVIKGIAEDYLEKDFLQFHLRKKDGSFERIFSFQPILRRFEKGIYQIGVVRTRKSENFWKRKLEILVKEIDPKELPFQVHIIDVGSEGQSIPELKELSDAGFASYSFAKTKKEARQIVEKALDIKKTPLWLYFILPAIGILIGLFFFIRRKKQISKDNENN